MRTILPGLVIAVCITALHCKKTHEIEHTVVDNLEFTEVRDFGPNPGNLTMYSFAPVQMPARSRPLVVVLHGCWGSAGQISRAGWHTLARRWKFYVLYPEQKEENNPMKCFNWFQPDDSKRGKGEAGSIKRMIDAMITRYPIDRSRIFVAGFSSGAFMSVVMAATYPDVISAIAAMSGGPYGCETEQSGSDGFLRCTREDLPTKPRDWMDRIIKSNDYDEPLGVKWPRVAFWHGLLDDSVDPQNLRDAVAQWTTIHRIGRRPSRTSTIGPTIIHREYRKGNTVLVETYTLTRMGHTIPIMPPKCGEPDEWFSSENVCFAEHACRFFGIIADTRRLK